MTHSSLAILMAKGVLVHGHIGGKPVKRINTQRRVISRAVVALWVLP